MPCCAIGHAFKIPNFSFLFQILGENPDLLKEANGDGLTPLHIACKEDMPDCVQALLCAGETKKTIDNILDEDCHVTSNRFYGCITLKKDPVKDLKKLIGSLMQKG